MKRILLVSVVLFVFLAMVSCASWYTGGKTFRARGTVATYQPGKMVTLQAGMEMIETEGTDYIAAPANAPQPVFAYAITPDTEVKGQIKPGTHVLIRYTQVGTGDSAQKTAVSVDAVWSK